MIIGLTNTRVYNHTMLIKMTVTQFSRLRAIYEASNCEMEAREEREMRMYLRYRWSSATFPKSGS